MTEGAFEYQVTARCAIEAAAEMLGDFTKQGALHPLVVRIEELPPQGEALRSYAITDRLAYGPARFHITYHADILVASRHEVRSVARQSPGTTVINRTTIVDDGNGAVHIAVAITIRAPWLLFRYAYRQARAAHLELADRMRAVLEAPPVA